MEKGTHMKKKLIALLTFIADHIDVAKSKAGTGLCCYELGQITPHLQELQTLASACNWQVKHFPSAYNPKKQTMSEPMYYIGPMANAKATRAEVLDMAE